MAPAPGVEIYPVYATGSIAGLGGLSLTGVPLQLSQAHSLAYTREGLFLANVQTHTGATNFSEVAVFQQAGTLSLGGDSTIHPFGNVIAEGPFEGAYITGTNLATGLLSLGVPRSPLPDAGSDGGSPGEEGGEDGSADGAVDAGDDVGIEPLEDAGNMKYETASLTNFPPGTSITSLPPSNNFQATWLSMSSVDSRILVATAGAPSSNPIVWYAYDVGSVTPTHVDSFGPSSSVMGDVVYSDVSLYADNAFFAAEILDTTSGVPVGTVSLFAFTKASTYLQFLAENDFVNDPRIPIANVRDGLVAVAANSTRVAVVWGTGRTVQPTETLGGYAVFACAP
jgi:hypothetical protein